ncbi:hypothetical protein AGMMS49942_16760 [Spirochaetia bacterium]|nr:hypothetical protein AGMMS49942_16760 [Spirochaetia bacterium]
MTPTRRRRLTLLLLCCLPAMLHGLEDSRRALLKGILTERKIPFEERPLFAEYGGFGSSLHVFLPAAPVSSGGVEGRGPPPPKQEGTFILAVPLSFTGDDRRDLPYAFETALAFIDTAREGELKTDILVAFLADEWSAVPGARPPHRGLRDLYALQEVPEGTTLVYLDMNAPSGELVIHHGVREALAPLNLLEGLVRLCDAREIPYSLAIGSNELYKLALADGKPALAFALNREWPALYLTGSDTPGDAVMLATMLLDYAASLNPDVENPDYHYLIFQFAGRTFFVPEYTTVVFFLAVAALFFLGVLVYSVVFRLRLLTQWRIFLKRSWIVFLFYALLILSLKGAAVIGNIGTVDPGSGTAGLFYGVAAARLLFGIAIFTLLSPVVDLVYIPWQANFYGSASVILGALEMLLAAVFDITFIPIFVWAFIFIFLAACVRKPLLVWLCCFLTVLLGLSSLRTLIQTGHRQLAILILSNNTPLIFYIALMALPLFFILKRGTLLLKAYAANTSGRRMRELTKRKVAELLIPRFLFLAAAAVLLWVSGSSLRRDPPVMQPEMRIIDDTEGDYLKMTVRDRILLERRILLINMEAAESPLRFNLYLESGGETPLIYAAPMPFRYLGNTVEFILGEGPPNPFTTEIVLPNDFAGFLRAEAVYEEQAIIRRYPIGTGLPEDFQGNRLRSGE